MLTAAKRKNKSVPPKKCFFTCKNSWTSAYVITKKYWGILAHDFATEMSENSVALVKNDAMQSHCFYFSYMRAMEEVLNPVMAAIFLLDLASLCLGSFSIVTVKLQNIPLCLWRHRDFISRWFIPVVLLIQINFLQLVNTKYTQKEWKDCTF